jgi:hypothetical protein
MMTLLLLAVIMGVNAASLRVVRATSCDATNRETYQLWADVAGSEILRAVDANLVTASGTTLYSDPNALGGRAPTPPLLPGTSCFSFLSWNRISSGVDATMIMPNFRLTATSLTSGWFLSDPTSPQQPAAGQSVLVAQVTIQGQAGPCVEGPKLSGTLNLITNGGRQNPVSVCIGSGCTPQTQCELITGYVAPSMQQPETYTSPVMAAHLVRAGVASIPLDMVSGGFPISALPRNAIVGLAPAAAGQLRRRVLQITYLTDGSESRVLASTTQSRSVLVTIVRQVNASPNQCSPASAMGTVRDRRYSAATYIGTVSGGRVTLSVAPVASVAIDVSSLPADFDHCGVIDDLVMQARGVSGGSYQHRVHLLGFTSICGRVASSIGSVPGAGAWSVHSDVSSCDSVDAVVKGLLHQFGLQSSDAYDENSRTLYSHGDGSCIMGRVPTAEGVQRRGLNALQLYLWGALPQARVLAASLGPNVQLLHSATYPGNESVYQLVDLALDHFIVYRSASDPGIDRQGNFAQPSINPLNVPSFSGRVLTYKRLADGHTQLLGSLDLGVRATPGGVIPIQVAYVDRYFAQLMISLPSPPLPPGATPIPAAGSAYVDSVPTDVAVQTSYLRNAQQAFSDSATLTLGVNGNDNDPNVFVRLSVPIPQFSQIATAELLLETNSRQLQAAAGTLGLEVTAEAVDNSSPLAPGSNLLSRSWSATRVAVTVTASQYWHDEVVLDVSRLLQEVVNRAGWSANQYVTFRVHTSGGSFGAYRVAYSGVSCGPSYGGGNYACGPRLAASYVQSGAPLPTTTTLFATVAPTTTTSTTTSTTTTTTLAPTTTKTVAPTTTTTTLAPTTTSTLAPTTTSKTTTTLAPTTTSTLAPTTTSKTTTTLAPTTTSTLAPTTTSTLPPTTTSKTTTTLAPTTTSTLPPTTTSKTTTTLAPTTTKPTAKPTTTSTTLETLGGAPLPTAGPTTTPATTTAAAGAGATTTAARATTTGQTVAPTTPPVFDAAAGAAPLLPIAMLAIALGLLL